MKILFLGPAQSPLITIMKARGDDVYSQESKLNFEELREQNPEMIVSFGYRHIIKKDVLDHFPKRIINLHISFLPWNRGADPNFWSFLENTAKGVSIHYVNEGLDTGEIIMQKNVSFSENETLSTSYKKLQEEILELFKANWNDIKSGKIQAQFQKGEGSFHRTKDKEKFGFLTEMLGHNTPVSKIEAYGRKNLFVNKTLVEQY